MAVKRLLRFPTIALTVLAMALTAACDDNTAFIGADIMPDFDEVTTDQSIYTLTSRSVESGAVLANTNECYLGRIIDPETKSMTTCNFLAQFHVMENCRLPELKNMIHDDNGRAVADSCDIRIYLNSYYGDSLTVMKLNVQELDTNKVMKENMSYYTDLDPERYINEQTKEKVQLAYSIKDLSRPDSLTDGSSYYRSIIVRLSPEYGKFILNKYYENPDFFRNSYQFINHVCPGFYFKTAGGIGSMANIEVSTLNVYFRYHTKNTAGNDTIIEGMQRMAATEEVIQNTQVENTLPENMLDPENPYTYVKSPTGIFTEVTLPVHDIVAGEHYNDTINTAKVSFRRYNNTTQNPYNLKAPATLLMVRKNSMQKFFEEDKLPDNRTAFLATFNEANNAYTFTNIGQLITSLKNERDKGAGVTAADDESTRNAKYAAWEAKEENAGWNQVMLIPVKAEYSTSSSIYGGSSQTLLRVRNDLSLSSVKLDGGSSGNLYIDVIYSRFNKK